MPIQITRSGKRTLFIETPVMPAAGTAGFAFAYDGLVQGDKLGAFVTNPITFEPWSPASGTRVVPMDAGVLVHTGLPNPGLRKLIKEYRHIWGSMPMPTIVHLVGTAPDHIEDAMAHLNAVDSVAAVELGLDDDISRGDAQELVKAATYQAEKPVIVRLPAYDALSLARVCVEAGADALVVAAPPRGTARDPRTGRLVGGRVYGPLVKPMLLRLVGVMVKRISEVPIIGAGGIHSPQDARDFLDAGAVAVQVDSVTWLQPSMLERIARDLQGNLVTRASDAFPDEWHPDMGDTEFKALFSDDEDDDPAPR